MTEQPAERPKRRRGARTIALPGVLLVMLPAWYCVAWLTAAIALNHRHVPLSYGQHAERAFHPLLAYANSDVAGSVHLRRLFCRVVMLDSSYAFGPARLVKNTDKVLHGELSPIIEGTMFNEFAIKYGAKCTPSTEASRPHSP